MRNRTALLIFVKYPNAGSVKTRLGERIGQNTASELYRGFVELSLRRYQSVPDTDYMIYFTPPEEEERFRDWLGEDKRYLAQSPGNLGQRLEWGFDYLFRQYPCGIALGTDSPDLPIDRIVQAVQALEKNDVVLGPSRDGGYYLIGLSRPIRELFQGIPWSTPKVFDSTYQKAKSLGAGVEVLSPWYDVDTWEDLEQLQRSPDSEIQSFLSPYKYLFESKPTHR